MGVRVKGIRESDGSSAEVVVNDLKVSESEVPSTLFRYNYGSTPTPPPNSSQLRTDSNVIANVTKLWVHRVDNANVDNKFFLMHLKAGDQVYVQDIDNADSYGIATLIEDPIDNGSYVTFNIVGDHGGGVPLVGTSVLFGIFA